jgi:small redox-active disulfide protein 2
MSIDIKVLGPGCNNCHQVEAVARSAVAQMGMEAQVEKITDRAKFVQYGLLFTPGLVINEKLVCAGRIPTVAEVSTWLANADMTN